MKCRCGRIIRRHLKGTCMACRYADMKQKPKGVKVNPQRLPVPRLEPTRPVRIDFRDMHDAYYSGLRMRGGW